MGGIFIAAALLAICFGLGYVTQSHVGTFLLGALLLVVGVYYWSRPTGGQPDETDVLPGAFLVISALAFGLYTLGVLRGQRAP